MEPKFIFVTGGVVSSLGKGLTAAAIGMLLEARGLQIDMLKLDPYLNVDPGTMNPFQHGEVYVTDDGAETDLDLGHYYRYTDSPLSRASNSTSGQIYETVIKRERKGDYLGKTVQVIPHVTDEIKTRILACGHQEKEIQVVLVEIGGTVGDIESLPFLEAIRWWGAAALSERRRARSSAMNGLSCRRNRGLTGPANGVPDPEPTRASSAVDGRPAARLTQGHVRARRRARSRRRAHGARARHRRRAERRELRRARAAREGLRGRRRARRRARPRRRP